jgi:hypothetical protein
VGTGVMVGGTGVNVAVGTVVAIAGTVGGGVGVPSVVSVVTDGALGSVDGGAGGGVAVGIGGWVPPGVGSAWRSGVAVTARDGTGVVEGSSAPPHAPKKPAPPASNTVNNMDFRNFIVCETVP